MTALVPFRQEWVALKSSVVAQALGAYGNAVAIRDFCILSLKSGAPDYLGQLRLLMEEKI